MLQSGVEYKHFLRLKPWASTTKGAYTGAKRERPKTGKTIKCNQNLALFSTILFLIWFL